LRVGDIRRRTGWSPLFKGIDWVFHAAAVSTTPWAVADPVTCHHANVTGTLNLLEAARKAGVRRFVFSSSNIVYAAPTAYKVSKLAAEGYCETYSHLYGLSTIALRYSNAFGSLRQNPENVIMSMRASARERGYVEVTGDGKQSRDFTNVADICRASLLAAESDATGAWDICTGVNRTMNEVAGFFGVPVKHAGERQGDVRHIRQDPGPALAELGFKAEIPFDEGMRAYL
jgi:nucleoside-diphosphate-sugar epimerase